MTVQISAFDKTLLRWISEVGDAASIQVRFPSRDEVAIHCASFPQASDLLDLIDRDGLEKDFPKIKIWAGKQMSPFALRAPKWKVTTSSTRNMITTIDFSQMESAWVKKFPQVFSSLPGILFVYSASRDVDYPCLAVKPDEFGERRLNRGAIANTIGKPLGALDSAIAAPRRRCIETVVETGEASAYSYSHIWNGAQWRFKVTVAPIEDGEILVAVEDAPEATWQKGYWENAI